MLGALWAGCLVVPVVTLFGEPRPLWRWLGGLGLLILTVAYAGIAYAIATPWVPVLRRRLFGLLFAGATVLIALSVGALAVTMVVLPYWLWNLLLQARAGREAQARLAVTEERLRFARDVAVR